MAQAPSNVEVFDPNAAPEDTGERRYKLLPANTVCNVQIIENEFETTQRGFTQLKLIFEVLDGEFEGLKVYDRITYTNDSQDAVLIGKRQLASICKAVNHMKPVADWDVVMNKAMSARFGLEKGKVRKDVPPLVDGTPARYNDRNRFETAGPYQRPGAAGAPAPAPAPAPTQPPAAGGVRVVNSEPSPIGGGIPSAPGGDEYDPPF